MAKLTTVKGLTDLFKHREKEAGKECKKKSSSCKHSDQRSAAYWHGQERAYQFCAQMLKINIKPV